MPFPGSSIRITSAADIDRWLERILMAARNTVGAFEARADEPLTALYRMKFERVGYHPVDHRPLNIIEQVNQTWTFVTALEAARLLLEWHANAGALLLAPGAHASQALDIMSETPGLIGAETFAATTPESNAKMAGDLRKLSTRPETYRYIFFLAPAFPASERVERYCRQGIIVWSIGTSAVLQAAAGRLIARQVN
jgi:hypothetical protein